MERNIPASYILGANDAKRGANDAKRGARRRPQPRGDSRGFTLLELLVALVLMSIVALLAYASAQVSVDVRARVGDALRLQQSTRATREFLADALRNARSPQRPDDTTFSLRGDHLSFVAAGPGPPLDPDYDWRITIQPDTGGLELVAVPVGRAPPGEVALRLPTVTGWDVRVLAPSDSSWVREWPTSVMMPHAVAITLWNRSGPVGPPLHVTLNWDVQ
ncbi:MAG TPA: prepilin-type N-terminal cleavage/methylation domain-containing protein [Gemmatimonadaceae bacterium]|nr:prepilin-type N-terminal cleavage/methylation domain-containing protein [Gemmatimonadaceae bacterium]